MEAGPPGPRGEPFFGSSRQYARDPFRFISAVERAYGDVARFRLGPLDTYFLADPPAIERVLVSEADSFGKPDIRDDAIADVLGDGLLLSEGPTWERRRELATPAFHPDRLTGLADRIVDHAEATVAGWSDGEVVDIEREMTRVTLDVILDLMLGVELPEGRVREIQDLLEPIGRRFVPDPLRFAAPDWLPLPSDAEFERALESLEGILDEIVARRRAAMDEQGDLLAILLRARRAGDLSRRNVRDEAMTILLAGHDTTALALTYTWFLLSEHAASERRVHEAVDAVVGDERPGHEHLTDLEVVERVIRESMRLYPPVYSLFREPRRPVELAGYEIPTAATLMLPQWAVHRSERFWREPTAFDPDRWQRDDRPRFAYFPFGAGPRGCIGKHLALLEAQLILATVAQDYHLEFLGEMPLELLPSLTAHPRQPMRMRVEER